MIDEDGKVKVVRSLLHCAIRLSLHALQLCCWYASTGLATSGNVRVGSDSLHCTIWLSFHVLQWCCWYAPSDVATLGLPIFSIAQVCVASVFRAWCRVCHLTL
jgi:hypothetical protein